MIVETYEIEQNATPADEALGDGISQELIEELGLEGQRKLMNPDTLTRVPYRKMTKEEKFVARVICPETSKLEDYSDGIIPVRVLQVAQHAIGLGFFARVEVWHPENADEKDPFLVGTHEEKTQYGSDTAYYILARWGEVLPSIEELLPKCIKKWATKQLACFDGIESEIQQHRNNLQRIIDTGRIKELPSNPRSTPSFFNH